MKMKFIAAAVIAVCAQSAFALDYATTQKIQLGTLTGGTVGHTVYLTGASALRASVAATLGKICASGTFTEFSTSDSNVKAYSCAIGTTLVPAGMSAGDYLLMGLSVQEGSFSAVISQNASNFTYNFGAGLKNAHNQQADFSGSSIALARRQSAGGFMDVQPALFNDLAASLGSLSVSYSEAPVAAGQSFGIGVSPALYVALQTAQGLIAGGCASGSYTVACQPNITKSQYASLIAQQNAGSIGDWTSIGVPDAQPVNLCRRVATSGTQAASNAYFLGKGCSSGAIDPSKASDSSPGAYQVVENSGSGDVAKCLTSTESPVVSRPFAIGVISAENAWTLVSGVPTLPAWKFVKLDGVSVFEGAVTGKARQNTIDQKYGLGYEFVTVTRDSAPADAQGLIAALGSAISDPAVTDLTGIFIVPGAIDSVSGNPVFNADKPAQVAKASTGGNSCKSPLYVF